MVASLKEWSCYTLMGGEGQSGQRGLVDVTEVVLMEGAWSCYRGGHFNGGKMVMLQMWSV